MSRRVGVMLRAAGWILLVALALPVLYLAASVALMLAPASGEPSDARGIDVFIISNGVHAELVLPARGGGVDWRVAFPPEHFRRGDPAAPYLAVGWGDREFYLNTPRWEDLVPGLALRALLGGNRSVLHVTLIHDPVSIGGARRVRLSAARYGRLVRYIEATLVREGVQGLPVPGGAYGARDAFYQAHGSYSVLRTCNTWVGAGLREAGVEMGIWTPFDFNVLRRIERV